MAGRVDFKKYFTGAALITNFLSRTQGPLYRRPGSRFIAATKDSSKQSRLVPFIFSTIQAYQIEFGDLYIRFYMNKGQIVSSGTTPYEISSTYTENELDELQFVQSADTLFICHPGHPPAKLTRQSHTSWQLQDIGFVDGPYLPQNLTNATLQPSGTSGVITINGVPVPGDEKVVNGTFDISLGTEQVWHGDFSIAGSWIFNGNWAWNPITSVADHPAGDTLTLEQAIIIDIGGLYKVVYQVLNRTAGSVTMGVGGASGSAKSADGTYTEYVTAVSLDNLKFTPDIAFDGSIDSVSVKRIGLDTYWTWGTGWSNDYINQEADHAAGNVVALEQNIKVLAGKVYDVTFTVKNRLAGSVTPYLGGVAGAIVSVDSTVTRTITATGTGNLQFVPSSDFDGSIDDVSVKESTASVEIFQPGHVGSTWRLQYSTGPGSWCPVKILTFISKTQVTAQVMTTTYLNSSSVLTTVSTLGGTSPTSNWREGAWSDYRGFPRALSFYEERLIFAGNANQPQTLWGSVSSDFENFTPEYTITDAGPLTYTISSNQVDAIIWLAPGRVLMAGTQEAEYKISGSSTSEALTPTNVSVRRDTSYGSANLQPIPMGNVTLFLQRHGRKVRELSYDFASDSYVAPDLTLLCEHITKPEITQIDYQSEPDQTMWAIRSDGVLLSMIYERPQDVVGWSKHRTDGLYESVSTIPGAKQTEIWVIVNRTIQGVTKRYVECFDDEEWAERTDAFLGVQAQKYANVFLVDCGLTYDAALNGGVPVTVLKGLDHLAGKTVHILADGVLQEPQEVVASGSDWIITLNTPNYVIHAGLPYSSMIITMRPEGGVQGGTSQGKTKRISKVTLRVDKSLGCKVGPDADHLETLEFRNMADSMDTALSLFTGDMTTEFLGDYDSSAQVMVVQDQPLPLTICAIIPEMEIGNSLPGMIWDKISQLLSSILSIWR